VGFYYPTHLILGELTIGPLNIWTQMVYLISAEFLLKRRPNSGALLLLRALWTALCVMVIAIILNSILDNGITCTLDLGIVWQGFKAHPTWYAIVFAAVYTALYTRYASQWQYLADLYNRIKEKEIGLQNSPDFKKEAEQKLAQWKAGFVADARAMHLIRHDSFQTVAKTWLTEAMVSVAYDDACGEGSATELLGTLQ
jgi:uncharacterized membrane protein